MTTPERQTERIEIQRTDDLRPGDRVVEAANPFADVIVEREVAVVEPGTAGTATVLAPSFLGQVPAARRVFRTAGVVAPGETTKPWVDEFGNLWADDQVTDFVPDEDAKALRAELDDTTKAREIQGGHLDQVLAERDRLREEIAHEVRLLRRAERERDEVQGDLATQVQITADVRAERDHALADKDVWINRHNARVAWAVREKEEMTAVIEKVVHERDSLQADVDTLERGREEMRSVIDAEHAEVERLRGELRVIEGMQATPEPRPAFVLPKREALRALIEREWTSSRGWEGMTDAVLALLAEHAVTEERFVWAVVEEFQVENNVTNAHAAWARLTGKAAG